MFRDIMLAEDDEDDRFLFIDALNELGENIPVEVANNGEDLMNMLHARKEVPDIIFLDLNMPIKNGFQCLREIQEDNKFRTCKVIILTTSQNQADIIMAYSLGASLFVTKPVDFIALQSTLKQIITSTDPGNFKTMQLT